LHKTTTTNPFIPSWGRLEMKPHEKKTGAKQEQKIRRKQRTIKNQIKKR
jgi:hypothetical protein